MIGKDPRKSLDALIRERGEDYTSLSRMLGRNPAYVQQFIKRGTPKRLDEQDRRRLARHFGVSEAVLGGRSEDMPGRPLVAIPRLDVRASAGPGAVAGEEMCAGRMGFDERWLRDLVGGSPAELSMIRVGGDSMAPTLCDGDEIMVDRNDRAERLRDGIYVLRLEDVLVVKRIALTPVKRRITIRSDNVAYPEWADCNPATIHVIGRVVWAGRRVG